MKVCSVCQLSKKPKDFYKEKRNLSGLSASCKDCEKLRKLFYTRTKDGHITKMYGKQVQSSKKRKHPKPSYSKQWFYTWLINNPEFHRLYDAWVASGFNKYLAPSVDRVNAIKPYTEYNIQLMTWEENDFKGRKEI